MQKFIFKKEKNHEINICWKRITDRRGENYS